MALYAPSGRVLRSFGATGTRYRLPAGELKAGMMLCQHVVGFRGKILMAEGEVLSQKHIDQIQKWIARPGQGCLLLYTPTVEIKSTLKTPRERPECDSDPYAAVSVQKWYKKGTKLTEQRKTAAPSAAKKVYGIIDGKFQEVKS